MHRFLVGLLMTALLLAQGISVPAAMCRHGSVREHAAALASRNGAISAAAIAEDAAASVVDKKGALSVANSLYSAVADLPRVEMLADQPQIVRDHHWHGTGSPPLEGEATAPLLRPPSA